MQCNPEHSIAHVQLSAALVKLNRLEKAKAVAAQVLELHPTFRLDAISPALIVPQHSRNVLGMRFVPPLSLNSP
ncbi:hypothetical protein J2X76_005180 [Neorhizobium sp. 2083]|uniref:hypothetical protein n=1 Tax=Neorhizobium sp. 2083 TaxID=2817762 RepID=UPI00285D4C2E|nr:hypothetical protein [Neorhizobium sp. 2083]MDR6819983.1 hypothetical protein [Neorhizobium sp. 2083]